MILPYLQVLERGISLKGVAGEMGLIYLCFDPLRLITLRRIARLKSMFCYLSGLEERIGLWGERSRVLFPALARIFRFAVLCYYSCCDFPFLSKHIIFPITFQFYLQC